MKFNNTSNSKEFSLSELIIFKSQVCFDRSKFDENNYIRLVQIARSQYKGIHIEIRYDNVEKALKFIIEILRMPQMKALRKL